MIIHFIRSRQTEISSYSAEREREREKESVDAFLATPRPAWPLTLPSRRLGARGKRSSGRRRTTSARPASAQGSVAGADGSIASGSVGGSCR